MNINTSQRLYEYRKKANLSQEELAEKIGVSRQAVSKWERGEASPDTDNLIALSEVYGVSLDELVKGKKENDEDSDVTDNQPKKDSVHISFKKGIHVIDKNGEEVHVDWDGVHVDSGNSHVHVDDNGVYVEENGHIYTKDSKAFKQPFKFLFAFPYPIICVIAYLLFGFFDFCGGWAFGWMIFLTIPIYYTLISAIANRNANHFAYPVLVLFLFLWGGFKYMLWHPLWIIFLTVPLYYFIVKLFKIICKKHD